MLTLSNQWIQVVLNRIYKVVVLFYVDNMMHHIKSTFSDFSISLNTSKSFTSTPGSWATHFCQDCPINTDFTLLLSAVHLQNEYCVLLLSHGNAAFLCNFFSEGKFKYHTPRLQYTAFIKLKAVYFLCRFLMF